MARGPRNLWEDAEEKFLISVFEEHKSEFDKAKTKMKVWEEIVPMFIAKGYTRNAGQLNDKWNKLKQSYNVRISFII